MASRLERAISLFCAEEATGSDWEDEAGNDSDVDQENAETDPVPECRPELPVETDEMIAVLIRKEASLIFHRDYLESFETKVLDERSRDDAVGWMLDVQAYYHFDRLTAYLSINYLDRFLSSRRIPQGYAWMLQLVAVGCVSLAAKMEETEVPLLLDLQIGGVQHVFEARTIQRMELLILSTLQWRMRFVTPFSYLNYLLQKIGVCRRSSRDFVSRVEEMILNTCRGIRFLIYRPSVVALASIICACDHLLPMQAANHRRILISSLPVGEGITLECARLMNERRLATDPFWTSKKMIFSRGLSDPESPAAVSRVASFSSDSDMRSVPPITSSLLTPSPLQNHLHQHLISTMHKRNGNLISGSTESPRPVMKPARQR